MGLSRLQDFEANSRCSFKKHDLMHFDVYSAQEEKAGQVVDILVDEAGHLQYLVVELSDGIIGKQVLLPYSECQADQAARRVYVRKMNQKHVTELRAYKPEQATTSSYPL